MNKKKLRSFKPYLFDFLVIVLGVSVSFWFNQLAIKRSDNKERIKVLTSIEKEVNEIRKTFGLERRHNSLFSAY